MEPIGIGGMVVEKTESMRSEEESVDFHPPEGKPTKAGKRNRQKRSKINRNEALKMIQSGIAYFQADGGKFAIVSLPQRTPHAVGIVLDDCWPCVNCRSLVVGDKPNNGKCDNCSK